MSKFLWSSGSGREELNRYPPPSPDVLWIVNFRERKKTQIETFTLKKQVFSTSILETSWWLVFHDWFPMKFVFTYNISLVWWEINLWTTASETLNTKYLELIKRRSKVQEKNMSCERALNFDQWKTFSENYKPMRVWLWLVNKFTENCQIYRLFSEFIQTQKRYPTSLDKIRILTWKLLVISS